MELTQLRYVLQLASPSNFSKAADRLYMGLSYLGAPPARLLSRKLGRSLFGVPGRSWIGWRNSSAQWRCAAGR